MEEVIRLKQNLRKSSKYHNNKHMQSGEIYGYYDK